MATACSPSTASPTTANPSIRPTTALAAERKGAWSSTTSTGRVSIVRQLSHGSGPVDRLVVLPLSVASRGPGRRPGR